MFQKKDRDTNVLPLLLQDVHIKYWTGEFDEAIAKISQYFTACKRLNKQPSIRAFIILPQIYLAKNDLIKARRAAKLLLLQRPGIKIDPDDYPADFIDLIRSVRSKMRAQPMSGDIAGKNKN